MDPAHSEDGHPTVTIRVANLPNETTDSDVRALFSPYGAVAGIRLFSGEANRRYERFGYLEIGHDRAERAVTEMDGKLFNGTLIRVSRVIQGVDAPAGGVELARRPPATTDNATPSNLLRREYVVASVEKTATPAGGEGSDWHRYILASGPARITGFHRGTLEEVRAYAADCAEELNLRSATGKSARSPVYRRR